MKWYDPEFLRIQKEALEKIKKFCDMCRKEYTMLDPCIHHLPDGYKNDMRRKAYRKKIKEGLKKK